jgi:hypothetical protein
MCNGGESRTQDGGKHQGGRVHVSAFQGCIAACFAGPGCRTDPSCRKNSKRAAALAWANMHVHGHAVQCVRYAPCTRRLQAPCSPMCEGEFHDSDDVYTIRGSKFIEMKMRGVALAAGASKTRCHGGSGALGRPRLLPYPAYLPSADPPNERREGTTGRLQIAL